MGKKLEYDQKVYDKIKRDFHKMSELVLTQLENLEEIVTDTEVDLAEDKYKNFIKLEDEIDNLEVVISNEIIDALVLHQPAATDLRFTISIQRMALNLERVGDLVMNIVKFISQIENRNLPKKYSEPISNMLVMSISMVRKALKSFDEMDKDYAIWAIKNDEVVDDLYRSTFKKIIKKAKLEDEVRDMFFEFMNVNNIISNVERIADNATNIAEASIYFMKGIDIRHSDIDVDKLD